MLCLYTQAKARCTWHKINFSGSRFKFSNILEHLPIYVGLWPLVRGRGVFTQIGGPVVRLCPELWFWKRAQQREDRVQYRWGGFWKHEHMQANQKALSPKEIEILKFLKKQTLFSIKPRLRRVVLDLSLCEHENFLLNMVLPNHT